MNLRFLITTRPERDILDALSSSSQVVHKHLGDIPEAEIDEDIKKFIHNSLCQYIELDSSWLNGGWCRLLVHRSQHLFQWASTACKFIRTTAGLDPCELLQILLQSDNNEGIHLLDKIYLTILEQRFKLHQARKRFRYVMAVIFALNEPLSVASLFALFGDSLKVREIIKPLGSLLDGALDEDKPIRPLHTSFRDFLLDNTRSSEFHVDILPEHSLFLGRALIACMRDMLKFNVNACDLQDRLNNTAVPGPTNWVNKTIQPHLSYSCQYWVDHLQRADRTPELLYDVTLFFKDFSPHWLEATIALSSILSTAETCVTLEIWGKVS